MKFFFVYAVKLPERNLPYAGVVEGNSFAALVKARKVVLDDTPKDDLIYLSNVKIGNHAERTARGEVPEQRDLVAI